MTHSDIFSLIKQKKRDKIEELKFLQKQRQRTHGIDVYSLAIGETNDSNNNGKDMATLIEVNNFEKIY